MKNCNKVLKSCCIQTARLSLVKVTYSLLHIYIRHIQCHMYHQDCEMYLVIITKSHPLKLHKLHSIKLLISRFRRSYVNLTKVKLFVSFNNIIHLCKIYIFLIILIKTPNFLTSYLRIICVKLFRRVLHLINRVLYITV